nr:MAG TPA: hypothetical protein [Caudoviricetes sp.]
MSISIYIFAKIQKTAQKSTLYALNHLFRYFGRQDCRCLP